MLAARDQFAEDREPARRQSGDALHVAKDLARVGLPRKAIEGFESLAFLLDPAEPLLFDEGRALLRHHVEEVIHVGERVPHLLVRQRPRRPVVLLVSLGDGEAQFIPQRRLQAHLGAAEELRGDHRVIDVPHADARLRLQQGDVVVGAVKDLGEAPVFEKPAQGLDRETLERVEEVGRTGLGPDLDEADLLVVVVETVGLGVDDDRVGALGLAEKLSERRVVGRANDGGQTGIQEPETGPV